MLSRMKTKVVSKIVPQNLATWRAIALPFKRKLSFVKAHYLAVTVKEDLNKGNALVRRGLIKKKTKFGCKLRTEMPAGNPLPYIDIFC